MVLCKIGSLFLASWVLVFFAHLQAAELTEHWQPDQHPAWITRHLHGFTRAGAEMAVASEVPGRITHISVDVGDLIDGDADRVIVAQLDQQLADIEGQRAQATLQQAQVALQRWQHESALTRRELQWWRSEYQRISALAAEDRAAGRDLEQLRFRLDTAELQVSALESQKTALEAGLALAEAGVEAASVLIEQRQIRAPLGWTVAERLAEPGSVVNPGQPLLHLVDLRQLKVPLVLSTDELQAVQDAAQENGQLRLWLSDQQGSVAAQIDRVDPRFDPLSRKHRLWLRIDPEELPAPLVGIELVLRLRLRDPQGGLRIPLRFARQQLDQWLVHDGRQEYRILPLRLQEDALIISPDALPQGLILLAMDTQP